MHDLEGARRGSCRSEPRRRCARRSRACRTGATSTGSKPTGLDSAMSFPIQITIRGDEIEVGFEGAPPQMGQGGSNCTLTYTKAHTTYPLKCILSPEVPGNAGCYPADAGGRSRGERHELRPAARGEHAHSHRLVHRAQRVRCARTGSDGAGAGVHRGCRRASCSTGSARTASSTAITCSRAAARVRPSAATGIRRCSTRRVPATPRWSSSRPGCRCWCWRRRSSRTAAGRAGKGAASAR